MNLVVTLAILTSVRMEEDMTIDVDGDLVIEEEETPADSAEAVPEQEIDPPFHLKRLKRSFLKCPQGV
ncbi:hypothetical protein PsorP6_005185 [Peronosclerospora sorghi]|uniref:Uncharacterized protein n=1 Tax=Peronosclerospora sorghi TaxID=230839 RepID=A0ACC0W432_9STRA|nr:hypothetical protein PsorP6_005185 [Peronosclerospora sorghi]